MNEEIRVKIQEFTNKHSFAGSYEKAKQSTNVTRSYILGSTNWIGSNLTVKEIINELSRIPNLLRFLKTALEIRQSFSAWCDYFAHERSVPPSVSEKWAYGAEVTSFIVPIIWLADHCGMLRLDPAEPFLVVPSSTGNADPPQPAFTLSQVQDLWTNSRRYSSHVELSLEIHFLDAMLACKPPSLGGKAVLDPERKVAKMLSIILRRLLIPVIVNEDQCRIDLEGLASTAAAAIALEPEPKPSEMSLVAILEELCPTFMPKVAENYRKMSMIPFSKTPILRNRDLALFVSALYASPVSPSDPIANSELGAYVLTHEPELKDLEVFANYPFFSSRQEYASISESETLSSKLQDDEAESSDKELDSSGTDSESLFSSDIDIISVDSGEI